VILDCFASLAMTEKLLEASVATIAALLPTDAT
jgi:hypothetical protein